MPVLAGEPLSSLGEDVELDREGSHSKGLAGKRLVLARCEDELIGKCRVVLVEQVRGTESPFSSDSRSGPTVQAVPNQPLASVAPTANAVIE